MVDEDELLRSLGALDRALEDNVARARAMQERSAEIRRLRAEGRTFREIVEGRRGPLLVQLLTESRRAIDEAGARLRRTEAAALHAEGMTMDRIAAHFGVTRQRVSSLLRDARSGGRR